jgi:hypothetical protein
MILRHEFSQYSSHLSNILIISADWKSTRILLKIPAGKYSKNNIFVILVVIIIN